MLRRGSDQRRNSRKSREARRGKNESFDRDSASGGGRGATRKRVDSLESSGGASDAFVLYVEGARDREILACWARRIDHDLARAIERRAVILGGRRPARAISDFRKRKKDGVSAGLKGLVVLDRDDHPDSSDPIDRDLSSPVEEGLEVFIWRRRHIESYLIVPAALRRMLGLDPDDRRIEKFVEHHEHGPESIHAKRILGPGGSLSEVLGAELRAGEIARAMRREEFHDDILDLFDRMGRVLGLSPTGPEVIVRARPQR